ncbi:MAG: hypothetical protein UZ03_NOB001003212 [Nitrospira sp. OLB3]|nr:MAG: hypothetical protein UZ03_NOB001003212 [Nitrospira sp. OLB3]
MKKGAMKVVFGVAAAAFLAAPLTSFAGGTISGKVTYPGKSEQKEFSFSKFPNPKFCPKHPNKSLMDGDKRFLKTIEVGKDGGLKGAVVSVVDVEDQAFQDGFKGTDVVAEFCEFLPFSGVVVNNKPFRAVNNDADPDDPKSTQGVLHNPHSFTVKAPPRPPVSTSVWPRRVTSWKSRSLSVAAQRSWAITGCSATSMSSCSPSSSRCGIRIMRW